MEDRNNIKTSMFMVMLLIIDIIVYGILCVRDSNHTEEYNIKIGNNQELIQELQTTIDTIYAQNPSVQGLEKEATKYNKLSVNKAKTELTIKYDSGDEVKIKLSPNSSYGLLRDFTKTASIKSISPIEDNVRGILGIMVVFFIYAAIRTRLGMGLFNSPRGDYDDEVEPSGDGGGGE